MRTWRNVGLVALLALGCACPAQEKAATDATTSTDAAAPVSAAKPAETTAPAEEAKAAAKPPLLPRNDLPGLPNFAQVSDVLYRGAQPEAEGFKKLKELGVKTVVNLRVTGSDRDELAGLGLNYLPISFKPWHPEDEDILPFLKLLASPEHTPVFVHCTHGADRTGTMVALHRILHQGWTIEQAVAELPNFGFHEIWDNLRDYLKSVDVAALKAKVAAFKVPDLEPIP